MSGISSKIFRPSEIVDYSSMIITNYEKKYPNSGIMARPFVGFKILMVDADAYVGSAEERIRYLEKYVGKILENTACFLRETNKHIMSDGFWLVSLPVPVSQLRSNSVNQMQRILRAMEGLNNQFNISFTGRVEINVSGRCTVAETAEALNNILIPDEDMQYLIRPNYTAYNLGKVIPINDHFQLLRTSWDMTRYTGSYDAPPNPKAMLDKMVQLAYNISPVFC